MWLNASAVTLDDGPHVVEIDWRAASAAGANDGGMTLCLDGVQVANKPNVENETLRVEKGQLGAAYGGDTGTRGAYYFDAFESRRQPYIGPQLEQTGPARRAGGSPSRIAYNPKQGDGMLLSLPAISSQAELAEADPAVSLSASSLLAPASDLLSGEGETVTYHSYYYANGQRVAMRITSSIAGSQVYFLLGDHHPTVLLPTRMSFSPKPVSSGSPGPSGSRSGSRSRPR